MIRTPKKQNAYQLNPEQIKTKQKLKEIHSQTNKSRRTVLAITIKSIIRKFFYSEIQKNGFYLWGSVGSGKTTLIKEFFDELKTNKKSVYNYSQFINNIQKKMHKSIYKKPIKQIANIISKKNNVIFIDEFRINDIAESVIIEKLFKHLIKKKTFIICTSNIMPSKLNDNIFNKERCKGSIEVITNHMYVMELNSKVDYRLTQTKQLDTFIYPITKNTNQKLQKLFMRFSNNNLNNEHYITINSRKIKTISQGKQCLWIDFKDICKTHRNSADYIEIAKRYRLIIISNLVKLKLDMDIDDDETAKKFINLIDHLYNYKVRIIITSNTKIDNIYNNKGALKIEYKRCESRVHEMQSAEYIEQAISY